MKRYIALFPLLVWLASCKSLKPGAPDADYQTTKPQVEKVVSSLNFPIYLDTKEMEDSLNARYPVNQRIYSVGHTNEEDNSRISHIRVDVRDRITVTTDNGWITVKIPLTTDIRYEWWWWILGIKYSDYIRFSALATDVTVKLKPAFDTNWNFKPEVDAKVRLAQTDGFLQFLIGLQLFKEDGKISKDIQDELVESMDMRKDVLEDYAQLAKPLFLSDEPDSTWLTFRPVSFNFAPPVSIAHVLMMNFSLSAELNAYTGKRPADLQLGDLPPLTANAQADSTFHLHMRYAIPLEVLEKSMSEDMIGTYTLDNERKVKVKEIRLMGLNEQLAIQIHFRSKRIRGWLYAIGTLNVDDQQMVYMSDMQFSSLTNNELLDKAVWLADKVLLKKMEEQMRYSVKSDLDNQRAEWNAELSRMLLANNAYLMGKVNQLELKTLYIEGQQLILIPDVQGTWGVYHRF